MNMVLHCQKILVKQSTFSDTFSYGQKRKGSAVALLSARYCRVDRLTEIQREISL